MTFRLPTASIVHAVRDARPRALGVNALKPTGRHLSLSPMPHCHASSVGQTASSGMVASPLAISSGMESSDCMSSLTVTKL